MASAGQMLILGALGAAPAFSDTTVPHMGLGVAVSDTDLFESIDPSLALPRSVSPTFAFGGVGLGPGTFTAEAEFSAGGPVRSDGPITPKAPPLFWASYQVGANVPAILGGVESFGVGDLSGGAAKVCVEHQRLCERGIEC
jgi:hypothetical protein